MAGLDNSRRARHPAPRLVSSPPAIGAGGLISSSRALEARPGAGNEPRQRRRHRQRQEHQRAHDDGLRDARHRRLRALRLSIQASSSARSKYQARPMRTTPISPRWPRSRREPYGIPVRRLSDLMGASRAAAGSVVAFRRAIASRLRHDGRRFIRKPREESSELFQNVSPGAGP